MHVPIQSGANKVLKNMNRKYNIDEYKEKINELRSIREDMSITTDLIVGFPEESDEDFKETIDNIEDIRFTKIHTFPFSARTGTKATLLKPVNDLIKKQRVDIILKKSDELEHEFYLKYLNKEVEVLVEDKNIGLTGNYIKVKLDKEVPINTFKKVLITEINNLEVIGKVLD